MRCRASQPVFVFEPKAGSTDAGVAGSCLCTVQQEQPSGLLRIGRSGRQTCMLPYAARRMLHKLDARAGSPSAIRYQEGFPNPSTLESADAIGTCSDSDDPSIASLAPHAGQRTGSLRFFPWKLRCRLKLRRFRFPSRTASKQMTRCLHPLAVWLIGGRDGLLSLCPISEFFEFFSARS